LINPDGNGDLYDADYFSGLPVDSARIGQILKRVDFASGDAICEFGSGLGHILFAIQNRISYALGVDFSQYAVEESRKYAVINHIDHIDFRCANIADLHEEDRYRHRFDKVLMMDVTEHINDDLLAAFLVSALKLLKPGGKLIIHTPNAEYLLEQLKENGIFMKQLPGHIAVRNQRQYRHLLESAGFTMNTIQYLPHYRLPMGAVDRALMNVPVLGRYFRSRLLIFATSPSVDSY
jgi:2-polyprenyl-3-methyl-5-hydroxy-6-metoxy-1,4-benzoquinol methylase